jgi:voltage-gated potassium channel
MVPSITRRVLWTAIAVLALVALGTVGFHALVDESWDASFYRTVMTSTLTGIDSEPRGIGAELLTIGLALTGVAIFGYLATQAVQAVAREVTGQTRKERRQRRMIDQLDNHFIICGYGRVGRRAAEEFAASGEPFVVLDINPAALDVARERGVLYVEGSGTDDASLSRAGIERARGLIYSYYSDSENV